MANARYDIVTTAQAVLDGKLEIIEGVRKLNQLRGAVDEYGSTLFDVIAGVESETEMYPIGDLRRRYNAEYLKQLDSRLSEFLPKIKEPLFASLREIVEYYKERL